MIVQLSDSMLAVAVQVQNIRELFSPHLQRCVCLQQVTMPRLKAHCGKQGMPGKQITQR